MSYNMYLSKMKTSDLKLLKKMSKDEIIKKFNDYYLESSPEDEYYVPGPYKFGETIYSLGSYPDYESELIQTYGKHILEYPGADDEYYNSGYEFSEIGECGLKFIIDYYSIKIRDSYEALLEAETIIGSNNRNIEFFLKERIHSWNNDNIINFIGDRYKLTQSHTYEYAIFNLVALYKSFDWNDYTLIIYGY